MSKNSRRPQGLEPVNPLSALLADDETPVAEEFGDEELKPEPEAVKTCPQPDEFDPDLHDNNDFGTADLGQPSSAQMTQETLEEAKAIIPDPPTGVDHLGRPAAPAFNPNDPALGFFQGVDPSTGERIYSKR